MRSSSSRVWLVYSLCVAALLGGMTLMTRRALDLERAEREARGKAAAQERIRLALWRMDSSMAAMLARESARPWSHYAAFSPQAAGEGAAATKRPEAAATGEEPGALLASPLLAAAPDYARLYFQVSPDGRVTSPQVPEGGQRGMALLADADPKRIDRASVALERVAVLVPELRRRPNAELMLSADTDAGPSVRGPALEREPEQRLPRTQTGSEQAKSQKDLEARQWVLNQAVTGQRSNIAANQGSVPVPGGAPAAGAPAASGKSESATSVDLAQKAAGEPDRPADSPAEAAQVAAAPSAPSAAEAPPTAETAAGRPTTPPTGQPANAPREEWGGSKPQAASSQGSTPAPGAARGRAEETARDDAASPVPRRSVQLGERLRFGVFDSDANTVVLSPDEPGELIAVCIPPSVAAFSDASFARGSSPSSGASAPEPASFGTLGGDARSGESAAAESEILLVRDGPMFGSLQGIWLEWPLVRGQLLELISDLLPGATLEALPRGMDGRAAVGGGATRGADPVLEAQTLVSVPARLIVPEATIAAMMPPAASMFSSTRVGFVLGWVAIVAGAAAIGLVLRASVELSERRGRFVSAVTHELRTPLTTFRLYSQMLADGMVRDEEARGEYHRTLRSEAERLSRIVESVLDYAKLGKRGPGAMWASVPAQELIERLTPVLAARAEAGGLTLTIEADVDDTVTVSADPSAVERIMLNLVENACKYAGRDAGSGDEGGQSRKSLVLRARTERRRVVLGLRDFGPGVPEGERRRIFRPFQRGAGQESGTTPGLGLGLAFSRGLARDMGGDLVLVKPGRRASEAKARPADEGGAEFELFLTRA